MVVVISSLSLGCAPPEEEDEVIELGETEWPPPPIPGEADADDADDIRPPEGARPDRAAQRPCILGGATYVSAQGECQGHEPCFSVVQQGIDAAEFGATVFVFPGTYGPEGLESVADIHEKLVCLVSVEGPETTILDAEGGPKVVESGYDAAVWLEGFTVRGTRPQENSASFATYAIQLAGGDDVRGWVVDNIVEDNLTRGALSVRADARYHAEVLISGNRFLRNVPTYPRDGAVQIDAATATFKATGLIRLENNLFAETEGTALGFRSSLFGDEFGSLQVHVVNNTFAANDIGMFAPANEIWVWNNLFAGNGDAVDRLDQATNTRVFNNLFDGDEPFAGIDGNVMESPQFVDPAGGDFRLDRGSPGQGGGSPEGTPKLDLLGLVRDPAAPDIGAFESP